ncbi:MAG: hypothetical protein JSS49_20075 [Planctomycetes bacterium]|nr:hypothetical protein [Planctomycetota bacterium]
MLENMQLWVYGSAAVIDTVLLFALVERHNWRTVTVWMLLLAMGVWCWHGGTFVRHLVDQSVGSLADPVRWLSMMSMAVGLLVMPSAALHGACRLLVMRRMHVGPSPDPRLLACYVPMLLLVPISRALATNPASPFLVLLADFHAFYACWLCLASVFTAFVLLQTSAGFQEAPARWFYRSLAISMILIAPLTTGFVAVLRQRSDSIGLFQTIVVVSPIVPVLLFGYFVMRFQLLPLILERTLVYGAVLIGVMLFHAVVLKDAVSVVAQRYRLDLGVVEGIVVLSVILWYPPLRDRVTAALQSLVDSSGRRRTERARLAVQLAARAEDSVVDLLQWFTMMMQHSFGARQAAAWLCDRDGAIAERSGDATLLDDQQVRQLLTVMSADGDHFITRYSSSSPDILTILDQVRAGAVLRFQHADVSGLFLIGCRSWGQPPNEEDLHSLSLLVEQFGVTLQNSQLRLMQVATEHRIFQQEKLSVLGLLAGSLAHEIKNPLSSIKTITRVLSEELGPDSPHAEDLRMIGGEIDRLAASTSEMLEAARPPREDRPPVELSELLAPTVRLLRHLARERGATLQVTYPEQSLIVPLDQVSLREIVFNLISNAVDAVDSGGCVQLNCYYESDSLVIDVCDDGAGVSPDQLSRIFEPFFTTKPTGTGLGLFVVARRVRELGGTIQCHSSPGATTFRLQLPVGSVEHPAG